MIIELVDSLTQELETVDLHSRELQRKKAVVLKNPVRARKKEDSLRRQEVFAPGDRIIITNKVTSFAHTVTKMDSQGTVKFTEHTSTVLGIQVRVWLLTKAGLETWRLPKYLRKSKVECRA